MSIVHAAHDSNNPAAGPSGFVVGFNFRRTLGHVADDGPIDYFCSNDTWPTLFIGKQHNVDAGFWNPGGSYMFPLLEDLWDDSGSDPRVAGYAYGNQNRFYAFRVEVPVGTYRIWMGGGYDTYTQHQRYEVYDGLGVSGQSLEYSNQTPTALGGLHHLDALRTNEAAWVANYDTKFQTVTVTDRGPTKPNSGLRPLA